MGTRKAKKAFNRFLAEAATFWRSDKRLWLQFRKHRNWITRFTIDGQPYGGWYDALADERLGQFEQACPARGRILEMGSLEGGHSFALARMPNVQTVVGLEGREYNVRKAELVRDALEVRNVEFHVDDVETCDLRKYGRFDVCFNLGLLYHLAQPWMHLKNVRQVTDTIFLGTHYADPAKVNHQLNGYPGWMYQEFGLDDPMSGLSPASFWPSLEGLKKMLEDAGFPQIHIIKDVMHQNGPTVLLVAKS
jgi:hypothetical protein